MQNVQFVGINSSISTQCRNIVEYKIYHILEQVIQSETQEFTKKIPASIFFGDEELDENDEIIFPSINLDNFKNIITLDFIQQSISNIRSYGLDKNFSIAYGFEDNSCTNLIFSKETKKPERLLIYDTQEIQPHYKNTVTEFIPNKLILHSVLAIYHSELYRVIREWYLDERDAELKDISNKDALKAIFYYVNVFLPKFNPQELQISEDLSYSDSEHRLQIRDFILCLQTKENVFNEVPMKSFYSFIKKKKIEQKFESGYASLLEELGV